MYKNRYNWDAVKEDGGVFLNYMPRHIIDQYWEPLSEVVERGDLGPSAHIGCVVGEYFQRFRIVVDV